MSSQIGGVTTNSKVLTELLNDNTDFKNYSSLKELCEAKRFPHADEMYFYGIEKRAGMERKIPLVLSSSLKNIV